MSGKIYIRTTNRCRRLNEHSCSVIFKHCSLLKMQPRSPRHSSVSQKMETDSARLRQIFSGPVASKERSVVRGSGSRVTVDEQRFRGNEWCDKSRAHHARAPSRRSVLEKRCRDCYTVVKDAQSWISELYRVGYGTTDLPPYVDRRFSMCCHEYGGDREVRWHLRHHLHRKQESWRKCWGSTRPWNGKSSMISGRKIMACGRWSFEVQSTIPVVRAPNI